MNMPIPGKSSTYCAAIIIIGNEILSGRTPDANISWIADQLNNHGINLREVRIVRDIEDEIIKAVRELHSEVDYVFTTGGIGPTHDDITTASIAKAFEAKVAINPDAKHQLEEHYGEELNKARLKMASIPEGATLIDNPISAAPGFVIENVYVMAGVPRIMRGMFKQITHHLAGGMPMLSNTITCQIKESDIAESLADIQSQFSNVDIGSYPHFRGGLLGLSLVVRCDDEEMLESATNAVMQMLRDLGDKPRAVSIRSTLHEQAS